LQDLDNTNNGFISNIRRGTGFFFSSKALNDFLHQNSLSYVVRAHEVQQQGFKVNFILQVSFFLCLIILFIR